jgi:hypothetical protein
MLGEMQSGARMESDRESQDKIRARLIRSARFPRPAGRLRLWPAPKAIDLKCRPYPGDCARQRNG